MGVHNPTKTNSPRSKPDTQGRSADDSLCSARIHLFICRCKGAPTYQRNPSCPACLELRQTCDPNQQPTLCRPRIVPVRVPQMCAKCLTYMEGALLEPSRRVDQRSSELQSFNIGSSRPEPVAENIAPTPGERFHLDKLLRVAGSCLFEHRRTKNGAAQEET